MVSLLCEYGASVNVAATDGSTALHGAAYWNHLGVVEILLEKKADVTLRTNRNLTALDLAKLMKNRTIVRILEGRRGSGSSRGSSNRGSISREPSFSGSVGENGQGGRRSSVFGRVIEMLRFAVWKWYVWRNNIR